MRHTVTAAEAAREHSIHLLGNVLGATEPDRFGCCTEDETCHDHSEDQEAADLVETILGIARIPDADEAGRQFAALLRGETVQPLRNVA